MSARNPFSSYLPGIGRVQTYDAASRLDEVQEFSARQLRAALKVKGLQKAVRAAIERRLRKLGAKA